MTNAIGKGKRRHEFAEWHVACPAALHNYAKYDTYGMTLWKKLTEDRLPFLMLRTLAILAEYLKTTRQQIED